MYFPQYGTSQVFCDTYMGLTRLSRWSVPGELKVGVMYGSQVKNMTFIVYSGWPGMDQVCLVKAG